MRIRQSNKYLNNRNLQGTNCIAPNNTNLLAYQSQLQVFITELNYWNTQKSLVISLGTGGGCFIGRSIAHWYEKYPQIAGLNLPYPQTTYCEPNFLKATLEVITGKINSLAGNITAINLQIESEKTYLLQQQTAYENCLKAEELQAIQVATSLENEAIKIATDTNLVEAQTQQSETIAQIQDNIEDNQFKKYLPYIIGGIIIIGGGYYFYKKNKK